MGVMTLKDFRDEAVAAAQRGTPELVGLTLLNNMVHRASTEFGYAIKFRELEGYEEQTLLATTDTLTFPNDFRVMHHEGIQVLNDQWFEGKVLPETRSQYIKKMRTGLTARTGRPERYHRYGPLFKVRPVADIDYLLGVHYWKHVDRMVEDEDVSNFSDDWDEAILLGTIYRIYRHFNEFDRYQNVRNDFIGYVRSRVLDDDLEEFPEGGISVVNWKDHPDSLSFDRLTDADSEYGDVHD